MTRQQLSAVICNIDDRHIAEAIVYQPEKAFFSRQKISPIRKKRISTLALAAALILSLGIAAYAIFHLGILDLYQPADKLPEGTEALIEP